MQPFDEKCEAIRSLLPFLWAHLALMDGSRTTQRYGAANVTPGAPLPPWRTVDCLGECAVHGPGCEWQDACRGEQWEIMQRQLSRKYRLNTLAGALAKLDGKAHQLAHAVVAVYVEPYDPRTEPVRQADRAERQRWADAGVRWLARNTHGDFVGLGERRRATSERIVELRLQGFSYRAIQRQLGCSPNTIAACLQAHEDAERVQAYATS